MNLQGRGPPVSKTGVSTIPPFPHGAESGIRTQGTLTRSPDFKSGAFNRALPTLHYSNSLKVFINTLYSVYLFPTVIELVEVIL